MRQKTRTMGSGSISSLLQRRGAWLKGQGGDQEMARRRHGLTRQIAGQYQVFERVRDWMLHFSHEMHELTYAETEVANELLQSLDGHGLLRHGPSLPQPATVHGKRFMSGGWLEELAYLAALEAGADEVLFGQQVSWSAGGFSGENEIDLIVRQGGTLGFVSCKALRSEMNPEDRKQRNRLMDAVHEADNLADHFGQPGERVAMLVTTDLFDELKGVPRYQALLGKAAVLDVRIIPLEELDWERLVTAIGELWQDRQSAKGHAP